MQLHQVGRARAGVIERLRAAAITTGPAQFPQPRNAPRIF